MRVATIKTISGAPLMRAHTKIVGAAVVGILASCIAFQTPAAAQSNAAKGNTATLDCQFLLKAYYDAQDVGEKLGILAGRKELLRGIEENSKKTQADLAEANKNYDTTKLDPKSKYYQAQQLGLAMAQASAADDALDRSDKRSAANFARYREANPELKSLWDAYQNCLTTQKQLERQAREAVLPPPPVKTKAPEPPVTNAEDVIWEILKRVRTAPDPEKELKLTDEEAVAWVTAMLEATDPDPKPRKTRKRTRPSGGDGDGGQEATQKHEPDASAVTIMLLGTAAGIAVDSLRHRGSGGGGGGGGSGGGSTPVKPGSGGCSGGSCPRPGR